VRFVRPDVAWFAGGLNRMRRIHFAVLLLFSMSGCGGDSKSVHEVPVTKGERAPHARPAGDRLTAPPKAIATH
jgi:hypothetical protein